MSLRDWRLRRVLGLSCLWMLIVVAGVVLRTSQVLRAAHDAHPSGDYYVAVEIPGGGGLLLGPPLLLLAAWRWRRRPRAAG